MARIKSNRVNWNLLKAFFGIAEHRTLADAARAANVQRPTISEKVSKLEAELGLRLMDRQPGNDRLRLTPKGERLQRLLVEFNKELRLLSKSGSERSTADDITEILRDVDEALSALDRAKSALHAARTSRSVDGADR